MKNIVLIFSFVAVCAFCVFSYLYFDIATATYFYENRPFNGFFEIVTKLGESKWYLLGFGALFLVFRYFFRLKTTSNRFLYLFLSVAGSGLIVDVLKFIFGRARPKLLFEEQIYGIKFFGFSPVYFSMPSGHSATVFALATGVSLFFPRAFVAVFAAAFLVAFSRVATTAHYLSDIVAGAYIGVVFALWMKSKMSQKGVSFEK
jgi:membrane-associated phospholipid phosphatase